VSQHPTKKSASCVSPINVQVDEIFAIAILIISVGEYLKNNVFLDSLKNKNKKYL